MKRQTKPMPTLLTAAEAAAVADVSLRTLRSWLDSELFPYVRLDAEGQRVGIDGELLIRFLRQNPQLRGRGPTGS